MGGRSRVRGDLRAAAAPVAALSIAMDALRGNKGRGALTTLGIVIGIVAVVLTMTAANGLQNRFRETFSSVGSDVLYVSRMPWIMNEDFFRYRNRPNLDLREARKLEDRLRGKALVNPSLQGQLDLKYRSEVMENVTIIATTEKQTRLTSAQPGSGRFFSSYEVGTNRMICVIGSDVQKGLFGKVDPVNKTINVGRARFRIIGVMETQGGGFLGGPNFDRQVFVPIGSYLNAFGGGRGHEDVAIAVKAPSQEKLSNLEYEVIGEMRKIRRLRPAQGDNFSVNKLDTIVGAFNGAMRVLLIVGLLVTSISLFVGAIGVMNIMFVSVTERTREIGLRKAVGATRRSILLQFLFESASICLLGGIVGIALACIGTAVINKTLMPASVSVPIVIVAVMVSVMTGVAAGLAPAYRGARLDPIAALRHE